MSFTAFGELTPIQKVNWSRVVWKAARDQMFLKNFMSDTGNSVVHRITELTATEKGTGMLDGKVEDDFTTDGKPNLRKLKERVGFTVTREEADAAFIELTAKA